ncbi:MAG: M14 family zinc carboxypeptidase [Flavobacteriaceae bacterium]
MKNLILLLAVLFSIAPVTAQDYFLKRYMPYEQGVSSPQDFLGYGIGEQHTRHDLIVAYLSTLAAQSERAKLIEYGRTHEGRKLVMLVVSTPENLARLDEIQKEHLKSIDPRSAEQTDTQLPLIINLAYNVHGNEPSSSEAALLSAYTLAASENKEILHYLEHAVVFIDPTINPDGRDRHTYWANMYKASPLVADPQDAEHNEYWPGGRTNHYWFDLNRDWILAVNPESQGKLNWYHQWYPNVVTDFHEMGSQSTYFFEPMKLNGSLDPIMPKENYEDLNELFGGYFSKALDSIGSFYFSREVFDGTYPGYGSSYPDLQGGLGLLFEQASSRGLKQTTAFGEITFPFTIRNQYVSSITTLKAAVENKTFMRSYQKAFFDSALSRAAKDPVKAYAFTEPDQNKAKAFLKLMEHHKVQVHKEANRYVIKTEQPQYRIVQTAFETYEKYRDSVYYDASAWSLANFYQLNYTALTKLPARLSEVSAEDLTANSMVSEKAYAYVVDALDYNVPALTYALQKEGLVPMVATKPFEVMTDRGQKKYNYGSLILPVSLQKHTPEAIATLLTQLSKQLNIEIAAATTGWSNSGVDLGSRFMMPLKTPKAAMLIGTGTRSNEAGEIWHLLDTRVGMPITKLPMRNLSRTSLDGYNVLVLVSGGYPESLSTKLKEWVSKGNTLITIGSAASWAIDKKLVDEKLIEAPEDSQPTAALPYVEAGEHIGRESLGGVFVKATLDLSHPLAFGYSQSTLPFYKNNTVWLAPSKNPYATVAKYTADAHVDGYISQRNKREFLGKSASVIVSGMGSGRVILFADNPNFRGTTYGMNRMFLNALFLGQHIEVPKG